MGGLCLSPFLFITTCFYVIKAIDVPLTQVYTLCNTNKYDEGSPYASNVNKTLEKLKELSSLAIFNSYTYGSRPDLVFAAYQCRDDLNLPQCSQCLDLASTELQIACDSAIGARIQLDGCFLRYESTSFFKADNSYVIALCNVFKKTSNNFQATIDTALQQVVTNAPQKGGFATAVLPPSASVNSTVYSLAQCMAYLCKEDCRKCLSQTKDRKLCGNAIGTQVHYATCFFRFEIYPFFEIAKS